MHAVLVMPLYAGSLCTRDDSICRLVLCYCTPLQHLSYPSLSNPIHPPPHLSMHDASCLLSSSTLSSTFRVAGSALAFAVASI